MDLRAALVDRLTLHPRVTQQAELRTDPDARQRLVETLPPVAPFGGRPLHDLVAVLDWDHRLPSKALSLRLHAFYSPETRARFEKALAARREEIAGRDLFPEFDVPDFADLPADEAYEAEVDLALAVQSMRLVSPWRRELDEHVAEGAVHVVRSSPEFAAVEAKEPRRSNRLGDLEAVSWTPPCETGHRTWAVEVWWITAFDGRTGRGWSFLVDPAPRPGRVLAHREFTVRTG